MEMTFNSISDVPDFGSICLVDSKNGYKSYRLLDSDINKLDLITNAANGSDAFTESGKLLIKINGQWRTVGDSVSSEDNSEDNNNDN